MQGSNERLTTVAGSATDHLNTANCSGTAGCDSIGLRLTYPLDQRVLRKHPTPAPRKRERERTSVVATNHITLYRALDFIQSATARPIAGPESSWMKCDPRTVTSVWFFQLRQKSLGVPIRMAPGSALTNSFGRSFSAIHC